MEKEFKEKFHNCYPSVRVIQCEAQVYRDARSSVINLLSGIAAYMHSMSIIRMEEIFIETAFRW